MLLKTIGTSWEAVSMLVIASYWYIVNDRFFQVFVIRVQALTEQGGTWIRQAMDCMYNKSTYNILYIIYFMPGILVHLYILDPLSWSRQLHIHAGPETWRELPPPRLCQGWIIHNITHFYFAGYPFIIENKQSDPAGYCRVKCHHWLRGARVRKGAKNHWRKKFLWGLTPLQITPKCYHIIRKGCPRRAQLRTVWLPRWSCY